MIRSPAKSAALRYGNHSSYVKWEYKKRCKSRIQLSQPNQLWNRPKEGCLQLLRISLPPILNKIIILFNYICTPKTSSLPLFFIRLPEMSHTAHITQEWMMLDEPDPVYQRVCLPIGRYLYAGQRRSGWTAGSGRRLYPFYSDGRKAARIASPILRTGINRSPGNASGSKER